MLKWFVVIYELGALAILGALWVNRDSLQLSQHLVLECALWGGIAGVLYCLRGIYVNDSARSAWEPQWLTWYLLRPIASAVSGAMAYALLKAGLLVLESVDTEKASHWGFYAVAAIAGLNVDGFVRKMESVAKTQFGIPRSNTSARERRPRDED